MSNPDVAPTATILALLDGVIFAVDGKPATTPPNRYAAIFDDTGNARPERYGTRSHWVRWTHRVVVVARTRDGLRDAVADVRDALTGTRTTPAASPLVEQYAGPVLTDGPAGDIRHSQTLTYSHRTPRSHP